MFFNQLYYIANFMEWATTDLITLSICCLCHFSIDFPVKMGLHTCQRMCKHAGCLTDHPYTALNQQKTRVSRNYGWISCLFALPRAQVLYPGTMWILTDAAFIALLGRWELLLTSAKSAFTLISIRDWGQHYGDSTVLYTCTY